MAKVLVPWSGGLDSTYLIDYLLREGHTIHAYYVGINKGTEQYKRELRAIDKIKGFFEPYSFEYKGVAFDLTFNIGGNQLLAYQFLWPLLLMADGEYDMLAIGYVMNDDAISWLNELDDMLKSYEPFVMKLPTLCTPLTKVHKSQIWSNLKDDIRKHVTWCESLDKIVAPCNKCPSCKRMKEIIK